MTDITFGRELPDQPGLMNKGVLIAKNVIPRTNSYGPFKKLNPVSNALALRCLGMISATDADGNVYIYAGTEDKIYEMVDNTFTDQSVGGGYTVGSDDVWEFVVWDDNSKVLATNGADVPQSIDIGGGGVGAFAAMITSVVQPPTKAKHIGIMHRFVILGNVTDGSDGYVPNRIRWSALGDEKDFDTSSVTQADFEDLVEGGAVQKIIGFPNFGVVFQASQIRVMQPGAGNAIFSISVADKQRGTPIPQSVIGHGRSIFSINEEGFYVFDGKQSIPIGNSQVDRAFWKEFDIANKRYVSVAIDPLNKLVCWAYPGEGATGNLPNRLRICKWDELRWSECDIDLEIISTVHTQGYTLDGLDSVSTDIDGGFTESFDSDVWKGGKGRLAAINQSHILGHFNGANLGGVIETGDIQFGRLRSQINSARPLIDGSGLASVSVSSRRRLNDAITYGTAVAMNSDGECPLLSEGRYHRIRTSISSSLTWSHVQGLEVDHVGTGAI